MGDIKLGEVGPGVSEVARNALDLRGGDNVSYALPVVSPTIILNRSTDPIPVQYPSSGRNQIPFWVKYINAAGAGTAVSRYSTGCPVTVIDYTIPNGFRVVLTSCILFNPHAAVKYVDFSITAGNAEADMIFTMNAAAGTIQQIVFPTPVILEAGSHIQPLVGGAAGDTTRFFISGFFERV